MNTYETKIGGKKVLIKAGSLSRAYAIARKKHIDYKVAKSLEKEGYPQSDLKRAIRKKANPFGIPTLNELMRM